MQARITELEEENATLRKQLKRTDNMTRNTALRLLALLTTLLFSSLASDPALGYLSLFVVWGLSTVALGKLLVALFGDGHTSRRYPSGGEL